MNDLIRKLDLSAYLSEFKALFAREKNIFLQGDSKLHFSRINELCIINFTPPPSLKNLDTALIHLSKQGILHLDELFSFVKILRYFAYLKTLKFEQNLKIWFDRIELNSQILELCENFDDKGELKISIDERLQNLNEALKIKTEDLRAQLRKMLYSKALAPYLIDTQLHFLNNFECLLLRGGFNHVLSGRVIGRSSGGGFYVLPSLSEKIFDECEKIRAKIEEIHYEYAKKFSAIFTKNLAFLRFINQAFDLFDHYSARALMAKSHDLEFILCQNDDEIMLKNFAHPALKNPKSIDLEFKKQVLIITGVNAGGKSMLLKAILSAAFLAKYLLPMKINANLSKIGSFKEFDAIIEDPQNARNDISTFAGRMLHFSKLFTRKNLLLGVDEIELGTDFEEAACLYKVLIEKLIENKHKIIITTHHKILAHLLSKNPNVELLAALYDEKLRKPKYEFSKGIIGNSYAFETALRYQISANLVAKAREIYGSDKQNLDHLRNKYINLESKLNQKLAKIDKEKNELEKLKNKLKNQKEHNEIILKNQISKLEFDFYKATEEIKKSMKKSDIKEKLRQLNRANKFKKNIKLPEFKQEESFSLGDFVEKNDGSFKGEIIKLFKNDAEINAGNINARIPFKDLKKSKKPTKKQAIVEVSLDTPKNVRNYIDLHGFKAEEALNALENFISDVLCAGYNNAHINHGKGSGELAKIVKNFLKENKFVKDFYDAPPHMGGFGVKIVKL